MKVNPIVKRIAARVLKIIAWTAFSIIFLLVSLSLLIQIPVVQNKVVQKAVSFLQQKIKTEVRLEHVSIAFPKKIILTGLYLEDKRRDTLFYAGELGIDTDLWNLTKKKILLDQIELSALTGNLSRSSTDNAFNFTYIVDSFKGDTIQSESPDTTASPWTFSLGSVEITDAKISYQDSLSGTLAEGRIGWVEVGMDDFDLEQSIFRADDIVLKNVSAALVVTKSNASSVNSNSDTVSALPSIGFNQLLLSNIKVAYTDQVSGQVAQLTIGEAGVTAEDIRLQEQVIALGNVHCANSFLSYQQMKNGPGKSRDAKTQPGKTVPKPWQVKLKGVDLSGLSLQYYNFAEPIVADAFDLNHLWISRLNLRATDLALNGSEVKGEIQQFSFFDRSGFTLSSFQTQFSLKEKSLEVKRFLFRTPGSRIDLNAVAQFDSWTTISDSYPETTIELNLKSSTLAVRDLLYFQPHLLDSVPLKIKKSFSVDADMIAKGHINDLNIEHLAIGILDSTRLNLNGSVKGIPDFNRAVVNINLKELRTTNRNLTSVLPDSLLPESIHVPRWLSLAGHFKGSIQQPYVNATLKSSAGAVGLDLIMNFDSKKKENYKGELKVSGFNIGAILGDSTMGKLDMKASVAGAGVKLYELDNGIEIDPASGCPKQESLYFQRFLFQ